MPNQIEGKNPFEMMGRLVSEIAGAMEKTGFSEPELNGLKAKIESGAKLADAEKAKLKTFVDALIPAFQRIADDFGDDGAKLATRMRGQFDDLLQKVA